MGRPPLAEENVMKKLMIGFAVVCALVAGCAVEGMESGAEERSSLADDALGDDGLDAELKSVETPLALMLVPAVPAGCAAPVTCTGVKTCGAWSAFTQCAAQFSACDNTCVEAPPALLQGGVTAMGRAGCQAIGTFLPQNRTRSCVMRATGQTCIETGYLARKLQCSPVDG